MEDGIISSWKSDLQSSYKSVQLEAIHNIVCSLNEQQNKLEETYIDLINSDISYFLSGILIYHYRSQTNLAIKIVCHLSEVSQFFKHDFFRYLQSGLRLVNSFPKGCDFQSDLDETEYKKNILKFNTLMLKRAQIHHVNFNDARFSKTSLLIAASCFTKIDPRVPEQLDFINVAVEIIQLMDVTRESEQNYQNQKLKEIIKNLDISRNDLSNIEYFMSTSRFLKLVLDTLPETSKITEDTFSIADLISAKFLIIQRFILVDTRNLEKISCEIFLNLFCSICSSNGLSNVKYKILNRFLEYNGIGFLIFLVNRNDESTSGKVIAFKSRVALAEVMLHILKIFHDDIEGDDDLSAMRQKYLEIIFKCDFNPQNVQFQNVHELSRETLMFIVFKYYVMLKWKKCSKTKGELLSSMAFIVEVFKSRKISMDKGLVSMMFFIFTSNYIQIDVKENDLLQNSSATLMKYVGKVNTIFDFNFFKWWVIHNWKDRLVYEKMLKFLVSSRSNEDFKDLSEAELFSFDLKYLLQLFLDEKTPLEDFAKLTRIISYFKLNLRDIGRILTFYEKQINVVDRTRSIHALMILCFNCKKLNVKLMNTCCYLTKKIFEICTNLKERILWVQLIINIVNNKKT